MSRDVWEVDDLPPRYRAQAEAQMADATIRKQARRARVQLRTKPEKPQRPIRTEPLLLDLPVKPWSLNAERAMPWQRAAKLTQTTRAFVLVALQRMGEVGRFDGKVEIIATPRGVRHDPANSFPAVKASVDALVDYGVLPDDSGEYVARVILNAPVPGEAGLILRVRPV